MGNLFVTLTDKMLFSVHGNLWGKKYEKNILFKPGLYFYILRIII